MDREPFDILKQQQWELAAVQRSVDRFKRDAKHKDPSALPPGRRAINATTKSVAAAIRAKIEETHREGGDRPPVWLDRLSPFDPVVLAVVGIASAIWVGDVTNTEMTSYGQTMYAYSRRAVGALRTQAEFDEFRLAGTRKDALRENAELVRLFDLANPAPNAKSWGRFRKRMQLARTEQWDAFERVKSAIGGFLAWSLAEGAPEWFVLEKRGQGVLKPTCLMLTPHAMEVMRDAQVRAETRRPLMLPMLVPPNPWTWAQKEDTK